jgi:hypothetical protein
MFYVYNTTTGIHSKTVNYTRNQSFPHLPPQPLPWRTHKPTGVIEEHHTAAQAQHAIDVMNAHNERNGHPDRYAFTEG